MRLADGVVSEPFYTAAVCQEMPAAESPQAAPEQAATATADTGDTEAGEAEPEVVKPIPLEAQISAQTPTVNIPTASLGKASFVELADRHGSKYFPSAFVLDKHFTPKTTKKKLNIGGTNLVGKDAMHGIVADTCASKDFGKD